MFAVAALVCFLLSLFGAHVGVNLVTLGLAFIAAHLIWAGPAVPWITRRQ